MKNMSRNLEQKNRLDEMINIVEKHTRTARHLENCGNLVSPEQFSHTQQLQKDREEEINNIKNKIVFGSNQQYK